MHSARKRFLRTLLVALSVVAVVPLASAQNATVLDISPAAVDVSEQTPPAPSRIALFGWQGTPGTTYSVRFSVVQEPALIVAVGAEVLATAYDSSAKVSTVVVSYTGEKILVDDVVSVPESSFLIALDPGVDANVLPNGSGISKECYGPGANPGLYKDDSGDFGDDDGLNDPSEPSNSEQLVGFPAQFPGSFASTNTFYWCVVPPSGAIQGAGLGILAEKGANARLGLTLSDAMIGFMGGRLSRTLTVENLAIFSEDLQVGVDVKDVAQGASIDLLVPVEDGSTKIAPRSAALVSSRVRRSLKTARATADTSLNRRTIHIGVQEALTLSPDNLKVVGKNVLFSGFVDDLSLVGEFVEIIRIGGKSKCNVEISAVSGTVIARGKIQPDGSYNVKIPSSAVFNQNNKNSKLVARIPGETARSSREVSLSNRNRNLRQ